MHLFTAWILDTCQFFLDSPPRRIPGQSQIKFTTTVKLPFMWSSNPRRWRIPCPSNRTVPDIFRRTKSSWGEMPYWDGPAEINQEGSISIPRGCYFWWLFLGGTDDKISHGNALPFTEVVVTLRGIITGLAHVSDIRFLSANWQLKEETKSDVW